jgi:processive 1,2-diacylglycerol beta-glucosyltransferase
MREVFVLHGEYFRGRPFGCTFIRLLRPLSHPSVADAIGLAHGTRLPTGRAPGAVLVERLPHAPADRALAEAERLVSNLAARGIPYVYTTDDNLLDLHRDRPWEPVPGEEARAAVRLLARRAAGVIVSTEALRERMERFNPKVVTIPNFLDERLFGPAAGARRANDPLVIGYMGTRTHDGDLRTILRPLRELLVRARGRVRLEVVGVAEAASLAAYFEGLPVSRLDPGANEAYPRFPGWMRRSLRWDFAVAPLLDEPFARCKSDLKYLDYAALGIPAVFSDVRSYRETVRHRETGLVVPNEPDAWAAALEELAGDGALRGRLAHAACDEVYATRMLATNARLWPETIDRLLGPPSAPTAIS